MSTAPAAAAGHGRLLAACAWRFALVSLAGFAPWVGAGLWLHARVGEGGLYAACTVGFLLAAVLLLPPPAAGCARARFHGFFVPGFLAYAATWCACWFALGGRTGEWLGALAGGAAFVLVARLRLGRMRSPAPTALLVIAAQAGGYFLGDAAMRQLLSAGAPATIAMLAWGACHGLGFGLGLGHLLQACRPAPATA